MSLDWTYEFCLACDKQTDGTAYCSESCRLAEYEQSASSPSSGASSPTLVPSMQNWFPSKPVSMSTRFHLSPAIDFGHARSVDARLVPGQPLSPSHSHTSLCSIRSSSSANSTPDTTQLSEKAARELRAYARSFESVRLQRRRSY